MEKKLGLVLEGGGMRGAYTAGCLSWLIEQNIEFSNAYGISTGAVHLTSFLMKDTNILKKTSTELITSNNVVGLKPLLKNRTICDYDYLFNTILIKQLNYDIPSLINVSKCNAKYGVYDLDKQETVYVPLKNMNINILKACCTLPIIGKPVEDNDHKYLDGGITKMIPIEEAIDDGCTDFLIITTKPLDYVRKPAKSIVVKLMKSLYKDSPKLSEDYRIRHLNYYKQIDIVNKLVDEKKAIYCYPTVKVDVSRLKGSKKDLLKLFELGRFDMETNRKAILELCK